MQKLDVCRSPYIWGQVTISNELQAYHSWFRSLREEYLFNKQALVGGMMYAGGLQYTWHAECLSIKLLAHPLHAGPQLASGIERVTRIEADFFLVSSSCVS